MDGVMVAEGVSLGVAGAEGDHEGVEGAEGLILVETVLVGEKLIDRVTVAEREGATLPEPEAVMLARNRAGHNDVPVEN